MIRPNEKYLITTDNWFIAPDGQSYRSAFGTVSEVLDSKETLGIATNRHATNWYVKIGKMVIAGCQIHYAIQCDEVSICPHKSEIDGKEFDGHPRIYIAD